MTETELYAEAMAQFGFTAQMRVWNEETAELEEILNMWKEATPEERLGEIVDAIIMTRQLIWFYTDSGSYDLRPTINLLGYDVLRTINHVRMQISRFHRQRVPRYHLLDALRYLHAQLVRSGRNYDTSDTAIDVLQSTIDKKLHYLAEMLGTRYEPSAHQ